MLHVLRSRAIDCLMLRNLFLQFQQIICSFFGLLALPLLIILHLFFIEISLSYDLCELLMELN